MHEWSRSPPQHNFFVSISCVRAATISGFATNKVAQLDYCATKDRLVCMTCCEKLCLVRGLCRGFLKKSNKIKLLKIYSQFQNTVRQNKNRTLNRSFVRLNYFFLLI
jgi:hypothetical protein